MDRTFPETLSALRREKGISQRVAAAELHISQALLSHYENGAREPGLAFVCKVCDYYNVTADYLLCRTDNPNEAADLAAAAIGFFNEISAVADKGRRAVAENSGEEAEK